VVADQVEPDSVACYALFSVVGVGVDFGHDYQAKISPPRIRPLHRESVLRPRPSTRRGAGRYPAFGAFGCGQVEYLAEECAGGEGGGGCVEGGE